MALGLSSEAIDARMTGGRYDVAIVGAGPAGSSLAIQLARKGYQVVLIEKEEMPRGKLCGEFLSTEVGQMCRRLGVLETMQAKGARRITRARCTTPHGADLNLALPGTGLGLSRGAFDHILFERASQVGVHTVDASAVEDVDGTLADGFRIRTDHSIAIEASLTVGAYGRRAMLDRRLERASLRSHSPFVAFKAHFEGSSAGEAIEVHTFQNGYCGVLVVEEGVANVCWIVHRDTLKEAGGAPEGLLARMEEWSRPLRERLEGLKQKESFRAVGQLDFEQKELFAQDVCLIGDAAGMIAPLCGDGMGMAMQTAELAAPLIDAFLTGRISAREFRAGYGRKWRRSFRTRMAVGRMLHALFIRPRWLDPGLRLTRYVPQLAEGIVRATRG